MSDCDVTRFLFSRALRSVVMLSSQKILNDVKTKTVSKEYVMYQIVSLTLLSGVVLLLFCCFLFEL